MLQAEKGKNVKPTADGCTKSESSQSIGLMMFNRYLYDQPQLIVAKENDGDSDGLKLVKDLIRRATSFTANKHVSYVSDGWPTAQKIYKLLQALKKGTYDVNENQFGCKENVIRDKQGETGKSSALRYTVGLRAGVDFR